MEPHLIQVKASVTFAGPDKASYDQAVFIHYIIIIPISYFLYNVTIIIL